MPLAKPPPPRRKRCDCRICSWRERGRLRTEMMQIIGASYNAAELRAVTQAGRSAMLPRDET